MGLHSRGNHIKLIFGSLLTLFVIAPFTVPKAQDAPDPQNWCGTHIVWQQKLENSIIDGGTKSPQACPTYGVCDNPVNRNNWIPEDGQSPTFLRMVIHVLRNDNGSNPISSESEVMAAVNHLNQDFAQAGVQFEATINWVNSTAWRVLSESEINSMKVATAIKPDSNLNVWVTQVDFGYSFGTFPFDGDALSATGGIVMGHFHWSSANSVFAHEVGHCLGLFHIFTGVDETSQCGPCYEYVGAIDADVLGDRCADTPPGPTHGSCSNAGGTDPCSGLPWGNTQPQNYMGYTPQWCLSYFSPQQRGRMLCWTDDRLSSWITGVDFAASNTFGSVPLAVSFAGSSNKTVNAWSWDFGDGGNSNEQSPIHNYTEPGYYDVTLDIDTPDGPFSKTVPGQTSVYSDTMKVDSIEVQPGESIKVDIYATNYLPLGEIVIPISWDGIFDLRLDSFSTAGLRTEYFDFQSAINVDQINHRSTISLMPSLSGGKPYLEPGNDAVVSLFFHAEGPVLGSNPIELISYASYEPKLVAAAGEYSPATIDGDVHTPPLASCCQGQVGDADGSGQDEPSVGDISAIVDHLFISGQPLGCYLEADANLSGAPNPTSASISVADIGVLVDYLFVTGTPLSACP